MKKLFSIHAPKGSLNFVLLLIRIVFGVLMIPKHGYAKLIKFEELSKNFHNFMGLNSTISLSLAIFAELFCSLFLIFGFATRLSVIPLITTMFVALSVHNWEIFGTSELIITFLCAYTSILIMGPGKYSVDALISKK